MKNIYAILSLFLPFAAFSQLILNQQEVASRTVQDPNVVVLAQGFHATSSVSDPFVAKIGASTETPPANPTDSNAGSGNPSGTSAPQGSSFHDTQGNIEVNGGGQLQYTLPIALPPGVKSVAPQINLVYTSGSGNGIAGYGWNISGITAISRVGRTIEKDGEVRGIQLDYSDYYSFNGQRLILKSGEYGKDGAEYVTEKFSNVKIKSIGAISGTAWQGPEYWEVTFEDGSQGWYGATTTATSNARTPIEYNIVKWRDAQGNYITYNYVQSDNVAVISSIQWGGNEILSKAHFNEIQFIYTGRDLKEGSYANGISFIQQRILTSVIVNASGNLFKKYEISYTTNKSNYSIVQQIVEHNSQGEASNPVTFSYPAENLQNEFLHSDKDMSKASKLYADFNRDGIVDYIEYSANNIYYKKSAYIKSNSVPLAFDNTKFKEADFKKAITITFKDSNNFVKNLTGILIPVKVINPSTGKKDYELQVYSVDITNNSFRYEYSKTISFNKYHLWDPLDEGTGTGNCTARETQLKTIKSFDYNGDGIDEILLEFSRMITCRPAPIGEPQEESRYYYSNAFFNLSTDTLTSKDFHIYEQGDNAGYNFSSERIGDFNGDGIPDILRYDSYSVSIYNITKKNTGNFERKKIDSFTQTLEGLYMKSLYADFNGDGKTDILIPQSDKSSNWNMYLSNGKSFTKFVKNNFIYYSADVERTDEGKHNTFFESGCEYATYTFHEYSVEDLNNDGKSEIIVKKMELRDHQWGAHYDEEYTNLYLNVYSNANGSQADGNINFPNIFSKHYYFQNKVIPFSMLTLNRDNRQLVIVGQPDDCEHYDCNHNYVYHFEFPNIQNYSRVKAVNQGKVTTNINYGELDPVVNPELYAPVKTEQYPYIEIDRVPQSYVVSSLLQIINMDSQSYIRMQDFRYRGLITHLQGKGMIGFRQTARSSWYADGFENTKIWSGVEIDPLNDGVPIKEWSIKTNTESQIFPADISENNNQLLSFKQTTYRTDMVTGMGYNPVKAIVPIQSISKDFLKDITTVNTITYGDYYLPVQTGSNINSGFAISTTDLSYIHNPSGTGKDYYIGRPASKNEQMTVYGDSKGAKEDYTYENNLLRTKKSWNRNNSGWFLETYDYDGFGNIIEKTITNSKDSISRKDKAQYEPKGRFVIKKTDHLNLETHITYNDWGQVLTQTDPFGVVLTNVYDGWGKALKSKTNLSGYTTYEYKKESNGDAVFIEYSADGNQKLSYTNKYGQNYINKAKKFGQGQYVSVMTSFDGLGRKTGESEPYSGSSPTQWNTIEYDDYSRPVKATAFTGKIVETTYNGRTVTTTETNANKRFKKQTSDALGNIISSEDLGGVITFKYNAAGENTEANYEGNTVKTDYDAWGNKVRFEDPSNGVYEYQYKGYFGMLSKTISKKGEKAYGYNNKGQLISQKEKTETGNATDKTIDFTYNPNGQLIRKSGTSLGKAYSSCITYDDYGRVLSSYENSNGKYFIKKGIAYDDKMRVISYEKQLYSSGILTKVSIENEYDAWSGELSAVKEKGTGKLLWQLNEVNAKGQVTAAKLGSVNILNTYASNGFLNNVNHTNTAGSTVLQMSYSFNAIKNELNSRTRGGDFNIIEQFQYDDNNRLFNWTDPVTGVFTQNQKRNVYDNKGRITENDQVGFIKFANTLKKYQPTGMVPNTAGFANYDNDLLQKITYNENNDPVFIDGLKGDVAFEYGLTSMRQKVTYGGNFEEGSEGKFTKFYSEDGSYEVIRNNQTGQEKHLIYIGGTPYEANIVYLKDFGTSTPKFVFLHKDYLGSILAITDEAGTKLEQRHFDAWGNVTHLKIGSNAIITDKEQIRDYLSNGNLIVDRGYTSHEHFAEVGLIHMNGRLYDPLLRRFLNADENIQDPYNTQNYNKYGYVLNNPLMYSDPSGEFFFAFLAAWALWKAVIIGAAVGLASYTVGLAATGNLGQWNIGGALKSMFWGGVGGAVTFGIGNIFSVAGEGGKMILSSFANSLEKSIGGFGLSVVQAGTHAISQGVLGLVQGADFVSSAVAGFAGSLGASGWGSVMGTSSGAMIAFGALSGGIGAELAGGNFWQGAIAGGIVAGLNHAMHEIGNTDNGGDDPGKGKTLKDLKDSPPDHPEYKAPKGGARKGKVPNGKATGWVDKDGRVWVPTDHGGTHAPHWDRQEPKGGGYTNVYPVVKTVTVGAVVGTVIYGGIKLLDVAASRLMPLMMATPFMMETVNPKPMFDPKQTY